MFLKKWAKFPLIIKEIKVERGNIFIDLKRENNLKRGKNVYPSQKEGG
jgi:hypothetical protein